MVHSRVCTFVVDGSGSTLKHSYQLSASTSVYLGGGWRGQGTGKCNHFLIKGLLNLDTFQKQSKYKINFVTV